MRTRMRAAPLLRSVAYLLRICCATCSYICAAAVGEISTDSASRGPSAVAELLVLAASLSLAAV